MKGVVKVSDKVNFIGKVSSFTVLGDPGCDGLGGGARLEFFGRLPDKKSSFHHVLRFYFNKDSELLYEYISLADVSYDREIKNEKIQNYLNEAFKNEAMAHIRYQFFADDAHEKGFICKGGSRWQSRK